MPSESDEYQWELLEPNLLDKIKMVPPMPDRPWDLMLCYDEFRPGDLLNYDNSSKTMVLAFNVEQLGTSWMVPIAVRSARIKKVLGVWSHMLRRLFHVLLLADDLIAAMSAHACACATQGMLAAEPSTATVGVTVVYHERTYVIHYRVRYLGSGIRIGFDLKGADSLCACRRCSNVFKRGSDNS